jgi:hypothetical protein
MYKLVQYYQTRRIGDTMLMVAIDQKKVYSSLMNFLAEIVMDDTMRILMVLG